MTWAALGGSEKKSLRLFQIHQLQAKWTPESYGPNYLNEVQHNS